MASCPTLMITKTDKAMCKHMALIVKIEGRPFSYKDFESFQVDGRTYSIRHGTCRNKFSKFVKLRIIELEYNSKLSYYTLKGHHFHNGRTMTRNDMGISPVIPVSNVIGTKMDKLFEYIQSVPIGETSVHDIHFKFKVPNIYKSLSSSATYKKLIKPISYDIVLGSDLIDGLKITPIIHRTDTVTVSVACSSIPIPVSEAGILWLSCALTRLEERLSFRLDGCGGASADGYKKDAIPDNRRWIVTMWHFGRDKKYEYTNGFSLTWGYGREVLRMYTRSINGQKVQRNDCQEYPNKPFLEAVNECVPLGWRK